MAFPEVTLPEMAIVSVAVVDPTVTGDAWLDFWRPFLLSPGLAAVAALVAAFIAFIAATRAARTARDNARQEQWWKATMWAVDLTQKPNSAEAGFRALSALQAKRGWKIDDRQAEFIRALTQDPLDEIKGLLDAPKLLYGPVTPPSTIVWEIEEEAEDGR